ncbi:MAG: sulfurtransferase TusA family protein [Thermodesulfobacteriota bacterium]
MIGKADYTLDVRGIIAPFSILKISLAFQRLKPKQVMQVTGCDPEMQRDLLRVLPQASYSVVSVEPLSGEIGMTILHIQKES